AGDCFRVVCRLLHDELFRGCECSPLAPREDSAASLPETASETGERRFPLAEREGYRALGTFMKYLRWCLLAVALLASLECAPADSILTPTPNLNRVNKRLFGVIIDHTHNHGHDRRIWSPALCERRDLYVYLPPGFDPRLCYPLGICLHGATQDERFFLGAAVEQFDRAIMCGKLPPVILAVPDGSYHGRRSLCKPATFFANSKLGNFEDYLMGDVWNFMMCNYPILPEREAHALVGVSMGGGAAFALGMKYRDRISVAIGLHPV